MKTLHVDALAFDLGGDLQLAVALGFFLALAVATLANRFL